MKKAAAILLILCLPAQFRAAAQEPPLPVGLGDIGTESEPSLPPGLSGDMSNVSKGRKREQTDASPFALSGFVESRAGIRTGTDPVEKKASIGEGRIQLEAEKELSAATLSLTSDFVFDPVADDYPVDLEEGRGFADLREANFLVRPFSVIDLKVGRQILTWGNGDLVFINDLFPKDWNSFFIGRDEEYLKAPSDSVKASFFSDLVGIDFVYTPLFDRDRFIDGRRISFFNEGAGKLTGSDFPVEVDQRNRWFREDELAFRVYRHFGSYETALYGYTGYWKSPGGVNTVKGKPSFPPLSVYGASVRGPVLSGIGNLEAGWYDSSRDRTGDDPFIKNSEFRMLAGYEREIYRDLTLGVQYYLERLLDYHNYKASLPAESVVRDQNRHLLTLRLTYLLLNQNLTLSLFNFFSPSDRDDYLRLKVNYKLTDSWQIEAGSNLFFGQEKDTFFGQFENNTNVYTGVRYSFASG